MKTAIMAFYSFVILLFFSCANKEGIDPVEPPIEVVKTWRDLANERIDLYRKSDLTLIVKNNSGALINGATVEVKLTRHQFKFGAVVNKKFSTSPYSETYKETFLKYFSASGFANGLKSKSRGGISEQQADITMPWFLENQIKVRGHALQWEKVSTFRQEMKDIYNDATLTDIEKGNQLISLSEVHFHHSLEKWDVGAWDVINETINNKVINELVPQNTFTYWFELANQLRAQYNRPDIKLYLNDYQVISAILPSAQSRIENYMAIIDQLIAENAPIEGIGFQSRIKKGYIEPEILYNRLVEFEKYNLPYQATEFEIRDSDDYIYTDSKKKQILNELLTIYFSHPNTDGIWHWTFADNENGSSPWALFKFDGTPYPCGEEWMRMMDEDFNTNLILTTDTNGKINLRGFKGTYEIKVTKNGQTTTTSYTLEEDGTIEIILN
jgi:GH35 family endo-1,4-beta-xylanase